MDLSVGAALDVFKRLGMEESASKSRNTSQELRFEWVC